NRRRNCADHEDRERNRVLPRARREPSRDVPACPGDTEDQACDGRAVALLEAWERVAAPTQFLVHTATDQQDVDEVHRQQRPLRQGRGGRRRTPVASHSANAPAVSTTGPRMALTYQRPGARQRSSCPSSARRLAHPASYPVTTRAATSGPSPAAISRPIKGSGAAMMPRCARIFTRLNAQVPAHATKMQ